MHAPFLSPNNDNNNNNNNSSKATKPKSTRKLLNG